MPTDTPRVFISYSHDSECHCDQVLELAQQLRRDGIAAELDQFHQEELLHWPRWCEEQMRPENADFILCVCTAEYTRRVEGKAAADVGKGVFWEGTLIYNDLYDAKGNPRTVPVILDGAIDADIPRVLRNFTEFRLGSFGLDEAGSDYASLYRLLTRQPQVSAEELGPLLALPSLPVEERQTDFMALITAGLQRIEDTQSQHSESLGRIEDSQASQTETLAKLWQWLKRWRVWLLASVLLLAVLGGVAWWTLPARTAHEVAYQFSAKAVATRLRDEIEQRFQTEKTAAFQAGKKSEDILALEKNRDAAFNRVDDIVTLIEQGFAGTPDPIFKDATKLLELQGGDEALKYLESQRAKILANDDQYAQQEEAVQEKRQENLRSLLLEAELRQGRQQWDEALQRLQSVADKAPHWWEAQTRLGTQLRELARYAEAETHLRAAVTLAVDEKDQAVAMSDLAQLLYATNRQAEAEPLMRRALAIDEKRYGPEHPNVAINLNNLALLLQDTNRLAEAEPLMRRALTIAEKSYGPEHPKVAIRINNLAQLLQNTNRLVEAEPLMRRVLVIFEKSYGADDPKVAIALNNLALLLYNTNRLADAEPLMRRALSISEKSYGPEHPYVATALNNLAQLLQATNRLADVEPLMRRALAIAEKSYGPEHPTVAKALSNLALLLHATNRFADAEPLMRRALAIDEKSFGPEHPNVAINLNNLALLLQATNRLADAEPLMRRALAIDENSFGPNHPDVAVRLNNLATLLQDTNRLAEAEPLMRRALVIDEKSYGAEHPTVAIRLNNLAQLLQNTNRLAEAEPLLRRALVIDEKSYGPEHPAVATAFNNLAQLLEYTDRLGEAEPLMRRALAIDEKSYGPEHPKVAKKLNNLASLLHDTNRLAEAEPLMRRALAMDEKSYGTEHPSVARDLNNLALLLQDTHRLTEAEPLMRRALAIDEKSYGPEHPDVAIDINNLAKLLQATNRLAAAEPLMRRSLVILLKFTRATGHEHPGLRKVMGNYQKLITQTGLKPKQITQRLANLGPEAGYTAEEWAAVQVAWEQVRVVGVVPGSQAEGLGLQPGDVISRYAGEKITSNARLIELTSQIKTPAIPLTILRAGKAINLTAQPGKLGVQLE